MLRQASVESVVAKRPPKISTIRPKHGLMDSLASMGVVVPFARNSEIYGEKEPAECVYQVVAGVVRTYKILTDGRRQIGAFYVSNDLFGIEASLEHHLSAEAVSNCAVRIVKRGALHALAARDSEIAGQLFALAAREVERAQDHTLLLVKSAQERLAFFLLEMAERLPAADILELPMSRHDIADYLGLTIETVSRTLSQLETTSMIALRSSRRIALCNRRALTHMNA
jgi:CRP/FNR family nitrogen fixation transcriptional regulator